MVPGIRKTASRVTRTNWKIFSGLPSTLPALTSGDGLPAVAYKCAATISAVAGHTDVSGSLTIGPETISFSAATRKTFTTLLTALPVISSTGLDCQILIEALTVGGAPIQKETLTSILIGYNMRERLAQDPMGNFTIKERLTKTTDTGCEAGGILRVDGIDYTIFDSNPKFKPGGREYLRKLVLRQ